MEKISNAFSKEVLMGACGQMTTQKEYHNLILNHLQIMELMRLGLIMVTLQQVVMFTLAREQ